MTPPEFLEASIRLLVAIESFLPTYEESFLFPNVFDRLELSLLATNLFELYLLFSPLFLELPRLLKFLDLL